MSILTTDLITTRIQNVSTSDDSLTVELTDGRTISVPLGWYPRLFHGAASERSNWRLIGNGEGIHWESLDEDVSIENIILGQPSGESQWSLKKWLEGRNASMTT
jgi:hypothetical protein